MVGFGRQLVFAHTVGNHCLGTAYATANQVPNIVYDIVLGGALTSVVVPVLSRGGRAPGGDRRYHRRQRGRHGSRRYTCPGPARTRRSARSLPPCSPGP